MPVHYLLNNAPVLDDIIQPVLEMSEIDVAQEFGTTIIAKNQELTESSIDDLTTKKISVKESTISTYKLPSSAFDSELRGEIRYSGALVDGTNLPDWINLDPNSGQFYIQPEYEEVGNYEIVVQATDQLSESASAIVSLHVVTQAGVNSLLVDDQTNTTMNIGPEYSNLVPAATISLPNITINDVQTVDSSVGRELTFTIRLDAASSETITVDYTTKNDSAIAGEDYIPVSGTVAFNPGQTEKTITVKTTGTSYLDADESFTFNLGNSTNATIKDGQGTGQILPAYAGLRGWSRSQEVVTFSFFDEDVFGQGGYDGSTRESNAREPSEVVKASYRQIFEHLNTFVDRRFIEVAESESNVGNIRIVVSDGPDYAYAGGHIHLAGWAADSTVWGNGWESSPGIYAYSALIHELGHSLGMPHSFGKSTSVFDPEENSANSVMSYTYPGNNPATFMSYDIKSLQSRYGAAEYRPEDTVYEFLTVDNYLVDGQIAIDTTNRLKQTIWDSGGIDTFDFSGLAIDDSGYRFDLNQSKYQTTQTGYQGSSYNRNGTTYYAPKYGTSIAIDVEIENIVNSSSDDLIIANPVANTFSGYELGLTTGDDILIDTDNLDTLDLSSFSFFDVAQTQVDNDFKIELGLADSITIEDYFSTTTANRINILLDGVKALISDVSILEGDSGSTAANFMVNLSSTSNEVVELDYTTVDGNAKSATDYQAATGTITFNPGETSKTITVDILGDSVGEANETFGVNLLGNYGQVISSAIGTIINDDGAVPLPTLSITDTSATDGNNAAKAIFTVSLDRSHDTEISVDYTTVDGLAVAEEDYIATSGRLVFAPGETEKTIEVDIEGNSQSDRDENFTIKLSNVSDNATITDGDGVGNILDPTLNIALADGTDTNLKLASYPPDGVKDPDNLGFEVTEDRSSLSIEGNGNGWKEIPLGEYIGDQQKPLNPYSVIEFDFKSTEEGKLHGIHFEGRDHHAFYSPWEKSRFFQLYGSSEFGVQDFNNYQDSIGEWKTYQIPVHQYFDTTNYRRFGEWIVFAHEGNNDNSNTQFRNLQIKELLPISVAGVTISENDGVASFTLTIPEVSTETVTLDYVTADDTAIAGQDYTAARGQVTFAPGETSKTISVAITEDNQSEVNESFNLNLSNAINGILLNQTTTANITDNDLPLPIISTGNISIEEGIGTATVTISLNQASEQTITVDYSTQDNTAIAESDYQAVNGQVTFNPGETTKTIEIEVTGDSFNESSESFTLNLDNPVNATINNAQAKVTIFNDDPLPNISVSDDGVLSSLPVRDSNGKIKNSTGLLFQVSLDAPSNQTVKVNYATADGTAKATEDYRAKNKTLTFYPGETEKQVFVDVTLDETTEADENLYLNLSNPVNAVIADNQAVGTIEETRSLSVSDLEVSEDGTEALFTISINKPSIHTVLASFATADGTAKAGSDYTPVSGRFGLLPGETSIEVAVPLIDNQITEENETFWLNLTKPKYVFIDDAQGQATITDNDAILPENPGGIYAGLQLWLKAGAGITADNNQVSNWSDHSQSQLNVGQDLIDSQPSLVNQGLNYNRVLSFDGNDLLETINTLPDDFADNSSVFIVTKSNSNSNNFLFTLDDTGGGRFLAHMPWSNTVYFDAGGTSGGRLSLPYAESGATEFGTWHFSSAKGIGQNIFRNGLSLASDNNTQNPLTKGRKFQIGRQYQGEIAEVIVYNQALAQSDRQAVDSYLGIKYGFTLDQTTPTNYITADGTIIWDATAAGIYNQDIAGIAVDNASSLNQIQSQSSNNDGIVTIGNATDLDNGEALIWSNEGGAIDAESVSLVNDTYYISRQWQVQATGDVGTVDLSFDLTGLGYTTDKINQFSLLIDDDGDFSNATAYNTGLTVNGNEVSFRSVALQDSNYFTLAVPEPEAPGGIKSNLQLWLRGDEVVTNNDSVIQWRDRSGKERNYTPDDVTNQPVLATEQFNFNPSVSFDGDDLLTISRTHFTQGEVFFVIKGQDNGASSSLLGDRGGYNTSNFKFEQWWNKGQLGFSRRGVKDYTSNLDSPVNQLSLVSFNSHTNSSIVNLAIENNGILSQDSLDIGASNPISIEYLAQEFKGEIAEVIVFDEVLGDADKLKLRSNLAIKYGLSLERDSNYVNADNQTWWDAALAGEYNNDVAGIAQDDSADLVQVKSRSSNDNSIITITAEDTVNGLEDGEALVWGSKDQTGSNNVLQLDGSNDYGKIANSEVIDFAQDEDFTIEVKVKTDGSNANDAIIEKWGHGGGYAYVIRYMGDGTVKAARYDGSNNPSVTSSTKINDGEFHHVAFVKSGDQLQLYVDGELENTTTDTTTGTTTNTSPVYLGSRGGNNEFFNGNLKDVRIWNTARTEAEIKANQDRLNPNTNGLVAYLPLENDAQDLTNKGNNATFHNGASITSIEAIDLSQSVWQVQEQQGDVGTVSVSFDLTNLGEQQSLEDYALKISDNDRFDNAKLHTSRRSIEGTTLTFTGVDFNHGEYFRLETAYRENFPPQQLGEVGTISNLDHNSQTIELDHTYTNPVVFAMPLSYNGGDPAIARITNIQNDSFSVRVQEPEYRDNKHIKESLSYLVLEAGTWQLADGTLLEVGTLNTNGMTTSKWETVEFSNGFQQTPVVLSQVQTRNGGQFVRTRQKNQSIDGFQLTMEEEEALKHSGHATEKLGWLAIEPGSGNWDGLDYQANTRESNINHTLQTVEFDQKFDQTPNLLASLSSFNGGDPAGLRYHNLGTSQVRIKVEEDRSLDNEIAHVNESVDFLAIAGSGSLSGMAYNPDTFI